MVETRFFNKTKLHEDDGSWDLQDLGEEGIDSFTIDIPNGMEFERYEVVKLEGSSLFSTCSIREAPKKNATGQKRVRVKWSCELYGKIRYALRLYAVPKGTAAQRVVIDIFDPDLYRKATQAIEQNKPIRITATGDTAQKIWNAIRTYINK